MATRFIGTSAIEVFPNPFNEIEVPPDPEDTSQNGNIRIRTYAANSVDYGLSTSAVFIDLESNRQHGGFAEGDTLIDFGDVRGTAFDDVIRGSEPIPFQFDLLVLNNPGNNKFEGFGGNDILEGRGGSDILDGGTGSDTASYQSSPAAVNVTVNNPASPTSFTASGGDAAGDQLSSIENLVGSRFNDTLRGASNNNVLAGGLGNDTLNGAGGIDTADYSNTGGIDRVVVRLGLNGANGTGFEFKLNLPDNFFTQRSVDTLTSIENVTGTARPDDIFGNQQANTLDGRGGNNLLDGGLGNDVLVGGTGNDTVSFASHDGVTPRPTVTITLGLNGAAGLAKHIVASTHFVETDTLRGIENVIGSNLAETINGNEQGNILTGRAGSDTINGGGGNDVLAGNIGNDTINGGANNDTYDFRGPTVLNFDTFSDDSGTDKVLVSSFSNILSSIRSGNNLVVTLNIGGFTVIDHFAGHAIENIVAGGQTVVLATGTIGGNASGLIAGTGGTDTLDGRGGNDYLFGAGGADTLIGGAGNDTLNGGAGNDTLNGGAGADRLDGGTGADRLDGGTGNDRYFIDSTADVLIDASGIDTVNSTVTKTLASGFEHLALLGTAKINGTGNAAANILTGNAGINNLKGLGGNDTLNGGSGNDTLNGGSGNDILTGGAGRDVMTGGAGNDDFDFNAVSEMGKTSSTRDVITDFRHGFDDIDLSTIDANGSAAGNRAFSFLAAKGAAFTGVAGELRWFQQNPSGTANDKTVIQGDINGDKIVDFQIDLTGLKALNSTDFIL